MTVLVCDPYKKVDEPGLRQVALDALLANPISSSAWPWRPGDREPDERRGLRADEAAAPISSISRAAIWSTRRRSSARSTSSSIAGAALDVGRAPDEKPSLFLARRPDVIATPHVAGLTPQAIEHQAFDTVGQVRSLSAAAIPPGAVNADQATRLRPVRAILGAPTLQSRPAKLGAHHVGGPRARRSSRARAAAAITPSFALGRFTPYMSSFQPAAVSGSLAIVLRTAI